MGIKDNFENHPVVFGLSLIVAGFIAGFGTCKVMSDMAGPTDLRGALSSETTWQDKARKADWVPRSECAAYPVSISLLSPGNGSVIDLSDSTLYADVVLQASRPVPETTVLGLVVNESEKANYYVLFPHLSADSEKKVFRRDTLLSLPFKPSPTSELNVWALLVDDQKKFGSVYSSIEQIKSNSIDVVLSPQVTLQLQEKKF